MLHVQHDASNGIACFNADSMASIYWGEERVVRCSSFSMSFNGRFMSVLLFKNPRFKGPLKDILNELQRTTRSSPQYIEAMLSALKQAIPFDASCCTAVDPKTLLSIGAVTDDQIEAIHPQLFELEYTQEPAGPRMLL